MRLLVCGGRDFNDYNLLWETLDTFKPAITFMILGGARGADQIAEDYAKNTIIDYKVYPADWNTYGKKAGYLRNKQMLEEGKPEYVLAFWDGKSKGTANMIKLAQEANVTVEIILYPLQSQLEPHTEVLQPSGL